MWSGVPEKKIKDRCVVHSRMRAVLNRLTSQLVKSELRLIARYARQLFSYDQILMMLKTYRVLQWEKRKTEKAVSVKKELIGNKENWKLMHLHE